MDEALRVLAAARWAAASGRGELQVHGLRIDLHLDLCRSRLHELRPKWAFEVSATARPAAERFARPASICSRSGPRTMTVARIGAPQGEVFPFFFGFLEGISRNGMQLRFGDCLFDPVEGKRVEGSIEPRDGDRITVGPRVLVFRSAEDAASTETELTARQKLRREQGR